MHEKVFFSHLKRQSALILPGILMYDFTKNRRKIIQNKKSTYRHKAAESGTYFKDD